MQPDPPDLPPSLLDVASLDALQEARLVDADFADAQAPRLGIDASRLERVVLTRARMAGLDLRDSELIGCDCANADLRSTRMRRVRISGGRLTGVNLSEGDVGETTIADCRADMTAWAGGGFERVVFEDCDLTGSDWQGARLKLVRFERCTLDEADFSRTRFESVEMRGCTVAGMHGSLRGISMPWEDVLANAAVFATAAGVTISS